MKKESSEAIQWQALRMTAQERALAESSAFSQTTILRLLDARKDLFLDTMARDVSLLMSEGGDAP